MAERQSEVWSCPACIDQFFGGTRCLAHNPSPEERDRRACRETLISAEVSHPRSNEQPQEEVYAF